MTVPFSFSGNVLTLLVKGNSRQITNEHKNFKSVVDALKSGKDEDYILSLLNDSDNKEQNKEAFSERVRVVGDVVYFDDKIVDNSISQHIIQMYNEGMPLTPYVRFMENVEQNPSYNSRKQLFDFLQNKYLPFTEDGCFIAYKGVRQDFMDKWRGVNDNRPGMVVKMPREQVDDNPNHGCSQGLHVGSLEYAASYAAEGRLVCVEVNPKNVVCVPSGEAQKCRVCEYKVLHEYKGVINDPVYQDDYQDEDLDWDDEELEELDDVEFYDDNDDDDDDYDGDYGDENHSENLY